MKLTVIVISYNRPKMIRECLDSIGGADEVIIADDGSDFDLTPLLNDYSDLNLSIIRRDPVEANMRTVNAYMGKIINIALARTTSELVTYICDDDILAKDWFVFAKDFFDKFPKEHMVRGLVKNVRDIHNLKDTEETRLDSRGLTSGNFVHRTECFSKEGIIWPEDRIVSADNAFLENYNKVHPTTVIPLIEKMACYRRIHDNNLANFTGENYSEERVNKMLNNKWME